MKYSEENLRSYVEKCFKDSFMAENREYNDKLWSFEWIMIKNSLNVFQLFPIMWCKYDRVLRRVTYRLENNLMKNFGIQYGNTDEMRCTIDEDGQIDPNFTQAMFKTKRGNISLSIFDKNTNPYENDNLRGECMIAYRCEKLIFQYYGLDAKLYNELPEDDERRYFPNSLREDWNAFKALYKDTFGTHIGNNYEVICSLGIEQLK